jgi:hypothetical protein
MARTGRGSEMNRMKLSNVQRHVLPNEKINHYMLV